MAPRRPVFGGKRRTFFTGKDRSPRAAVRRGVGSTQRRQMEQAMSGVTGRIVNLSAQAAESIWNWVSNGGTRQPTRQEIQQAAEEFVPAELVDTDQPNTTRPRSRPAADPTAVEVESQPIGYTFFAPNSTNVYSYRYDHENHDLYVTFRPKEKLQKGSDQRANQAGYTYKYFNVPETVWNRFRANAQADMRGGEEVWDELRRRGSIYGTQFHYSLVDASEVNGATYVPRRATRKGFKKRSVIDVRNSRRGQPIFIESTLPEQNGFGRTRRGNS